MPLIRKRTLFGTKMHIECDGCGKNLGEAGYTKEAQPKLYRILGPHFMLCETCAGRGVSSYRKEEFKAQGEACAICGTPFSNSERAKVFCSDCCERHPDSTHRYDDSYNYVWVPADTFEYCNYCGVLRRKLGGRYTYWKPGEPGTTSSPSPCRFKGSGQHMVAQHHCAHDYIVVADFTKDQARVEKLKRNGILHSFSVTEFPAMSAPRFMNHFGYEVIWCTKCGDAKARLPEWAQSKLIDD